MKNGKFEIFIGKDGKIYFRLVATNGRTIAASEAYESLAACKKGIESIRRNAPTAAIEDCRKG